MKLNEEIFVLLQESLSLLNDEEQFKELQQIRQRYESGLYFVAFVGQFSAGKSSLLNNLLGRKILPQGTMETTPILTYIRYGDEEKAVIFNNDDSENEIPIDEVKQIMQKGPIHSNINLEDIEHMEIYLQSDILRQGMVLLDTPGINTLIEKHERLLANTLALASNIVYVTGHAISKFDADKLSEMMSHGFPISFVRTRCDEINEFEESYEQVRSDDLKILRNVLSESKMTLDETRCFHISNLQDSKYFDKIEDIKYMLELNGQDVQKALEESVGQQLSILTESTIKELEEVQTILLEKKNNQSDELRKRKAKLDEEINLLSIKLKNSKERLSRDIDNCRKNFKNDLQQNINRAIDKIEVKIRVADVKNNEDMKLFLQKETRQILQNFMQAVNSGIDPILKDINGELKAEDIDITFAELPEIENYASVINAQNFELEDIKRQFTNIQRNRKTLEEQLSLSQNSPELLDMQNELTSLEHEIVSMKNEYSGMVYEPRMIEVAGSQSGAQIGKTIGNMLDWAMILLPQTTILKTAKSVGLLGKIATTATKFGKYGNAIAKGITKGKSLAAVVSNVRGVTKTYATLRRIEKVKDVIQTSMKTLNTVKEATPVSALDYLTIEHWGEKLGKQFDTPPRLEEDQVYRQTFAANKRQLSNDIQRKQEKVFQRKLEMKAFRNKQEQEKARLESLKVDEAELQRKLESQESKIRAEAKSQAVAQWKKSWVEYFCIKLRNNLEEYAQVYIDEFPQRLIGYQDKRFQILQNKLNEKKHQYDDLVNMSSNDIEDKLERAKNLLKNLKQISSELQVFA